MLQQCRPYDVKCIELDCHSSIYTMFVLGIINAMMNLKQFGPLVLICVEITGQVVDLQCLYLTLMLVNNQVLKKIKIAIESDVKNLSLR